MEIHKNVLRSATLSTIYMLILSHEYCMNSIENLYVLNHIALGLYSKKSTRTRCVLLCYLLIQHYYKNALRSYLGFILRSLQERIAFWDGVARKQQERIAFLDCIAWISAGTRYVLGLHGKN